MTDSRLARRPPTPGIRPFGSLPPSSTVMDAARALELAGVDATELALLASTTFKEAQTLEELVTIIATTRRRGLDALSKQVYYERFGGAESGPSLHVAIDGLRVIAARTGRAGGKSEPRFSGSWDMPVEGGKPKVVPEKCVVTVYATNQGRPCAYDGVAWMSESYPGTSARGRMWRLRPRGMLAIAAERQALRSAFPAETSGIADLDEPEAEPAPPARVVEQMPRAGQPRGYDDIFPEEDWSKQTVTMNAAGDTVDVTTGEVLKPTRERDVGDRERAETMTQGSL